MASRASHGSRTAPQQIVATLARADVASARLDRAATAFPREGISRKEGLMALRTDSVDLARPRWSRKRDIEPWRFRNEGRGHADIARVLPRAAVARLTSDADLDERVAGEARSD